jgi:membrane fusion protein (multidrug efflux system)
LDPIKAIFPISEGSYLAFQKEHPDADGFPTDVSLSLVLSDGSVYSAAGKFYAVDRQIDPSTGALQVAAVFPNPKNQLRPGQYGRVRAVVRTLKGAVVVPTRALSELQGSYQLVVVDRENKAHIKTVKVGPAAGTMSVIEAGIAAGDSVVIEGFQKVKEGSQVNPKPYQAAP